MANSYVYEWFSLASIEELWTKNSCHTGVVASLRLTSECSSYGGIHVNLIKFGKVT